MKRALGKGLSSLIPDTYIHSRKSEASTSAAVEGFELIPVSKIFPNPDQPREYFSSEGIQELADSIRQKGILQPIIVKKTAKGYELVCGERRLRAAALVGLEKIPAVLKEVAEENLLEWALIENIQREDLSALEEAKAYERLVSERGLSQEEVAKKVGKNRTTITNAVRLLRLPEEIRTHLQEGRLDAGHARALLGLLSSEHQLQMARRIIKENLSVRQVEELVSRSSKKRRARSARNLTPEIADLENRLSKHFGTPVRISTSKNSRQGRIIIHYFSLDELDRFLNQVQLPSA